MKEGTGFCLLMLRIIYASYLELEEIALLCVYYANDGLTLIQGTESNTVIVLDEFFMKSIIRAQTIILRSSSSSSCTLLIHMFLKVLPLKGQCLSDRHHHYVLLC